MDIIHDDPKDEEILKLNLELKNQRKLYKEQLLINEQLFEKSSSLNGLYNDITICFIYPKSNIPFLI